MKDHLNFSILRIVHKLSLRVVVPTVLKVVMISAELIFELSQDLRYDYI